jgi:hypothetical protein
MVGPTTAKRTGPKPSKQKAGEGKKKGRMGGEEKSRSFIMNRLSNPSILDCLVHFPPTFREL